ncbi:MAG: TonB-dependent receptor plug domain-containing protein [Winogradskyella sp.]|nr:TonB-dependent receptor plug domain-containing protein [Winogradskyella sp.]
MASKLRLFLFLVVVHLGFSQNDKSIVPLATIIEQLEKKFDVKVSYSVNDVESVSIKPPAVDLNLNETLVYLNQNTLLNWQLLDERYITVSVIGKTISICGTIIDEDSKLPLYGASVVVVNSTRGVSANDLGEFRIDDVPVNALISISYLGYTTKRVSAKLLNNSNSCQIVTLQPNNEELSEILITKFLTTGLQKRIDGSVVLNTEQFGILPGLIEPDILQSIQALPGVESTNESIANINVRGGTNDQNLVLWDGIKMYHSGHFFGLITAYNPFLTNKVVVSKNGTSSEFSDGVSSTINMFTKNELSKKLSGGAGFNLISADAFLEIPISKSLELHVSGRRSYTDAFNTPTYENYFERSFQDSDINTNEELSNSSSTSDFFFYDYSAKLLLDINDEHKLRANIIAINNNLDYAESSTNSNNETSSKSSNLKQENLGVGFNYSANWSSRFTTQLSAYYSKYNVDAEELTVETDQRLTQANEVLDTGIKLNTNYSINDNLNLLIGYQLNETGILNETSVSAPSYIRTKKDVLINHSGYSELEYKNQGTYFRAGIRYNYFQKFNKSIIEPRLNLRQEIGNTLAVKVEGEFKNQSATQIIDFQDDFLGVENRRWILANEETIPISTSQQGSVGLEYNHNNLAIDITAFHKTVEGITASNQGFYNNFQFLNATGDYTSMGIEFLANKTSRNYSAWISYIYSTNDYVFKAFTPSIFPNNADIRHSVSTAVNYNILDDLEISIGAIWRTGLPFTKPVEGNETVQNGNTTFVNYDLPNNENLDPFKRIDASLTYAFKLGQGVNAKVNLGVRNLTNEENVINRYFEVDPNDDSKAIQIDNKSLGFTPNFSFRINF